MQERKKPDFPTMDMRKGGSNYTTWISSALLTCQEVSKCLTYINYITLPTTLSHHNGECYDLQFTDEEGNQGYIYMMTGTTRKRVLHSSLWPERLSQDKMGDSLGLSTQASGSVIDKHIYLFFLNDTKNPINCTIVPPLLDLASESAKCDLLQRDLESNHLSPSYSYKLGDFSFFICKMKIPTLRLWGTA